MGKGIEPFFDEVVMINNVPDYAPLDSLQDMELEQFTQLASLLCHCPVALIGPGQKEGKWFQLNKGWIKPDARDPVFQMSDSAGEYFEVEDASLDQDFRESAYMRKHNLRLFACQAICFPNGEAFGSICIMGHQARRLNPKQQQALAILAEQILTLVTERKKTGEIRRAGKKETPNTEQESLLKTHLLARVGGWEMDLATGKLTWTTVTRLIFGVDDDYELTSQSVEKFYKNRKHRNKIQQLFEEAITEGKSWDERIKVVTEEGKEIWIRIIGKPVFKGGKCVQVFGSVYDIDEEVKNVEELKRRERMLSAISKATDALLSNNDFLQATCYSLEIIGKAVNASRVAFFQNSLSPEGSPLTSHIFEWNSRKKRSKKNDPGMQHVPIPAMAARLRKLKKKKSLHFFLSSIIGNPPIFPTTRKKNIKSSLIIPIYNNQNFWGFLQFDDNRSEEEWSKAEISLLNSFSNSISNAIDRNYLESSLVKAKESAETANKAKSDFLAHMSHEIRTPLNGVVGFTELLLKTPLNQTQAQYLNIVNQSSNTLLHTINGILDFSKIEAGKLELNIEKCDIYDLVGQVADVVSFGAHHKNLEVLLDIPPDLPQYLYIDETRLKQILINLLGNAVKFTSSGEVELKISLVKPLEKGYCTWQFAVRDTGVGIPKNKQSRVMEAFSQENASITKKYGGTGLGLAISNKLLELLGSRLTLHSGRGKGSTFSFDIVLKSELGTPLPVKKHPVLNKALVVDDNSRNRSIVSKLLHFQDIKTVEAETGEEALKIFQSEGDIDLVIMDYQMPGMDGLSTIEKMRLAQITSSGEPEFILMHAASEHEQVMDACQKLGINHQLFKPIKPKDLSDIFIALNREPGADHPMYMQEINEHDQPEYKVLIVEDNPTNMLLARIIIQKLIPKATIIEARNGLEAVDYCKTEAPSIVFMDIQMPVMNGFEATWAIKELPHCTQVPIIALSAGNIKGEVEKAFQSGMVDFLAKPVVENSLKTALGKWLPRKTESSETSGQFTPSPYTNAAGSAHLDLDKIKEYLGDDPTTIREVLELTLQELEETPPRIVFNIDQRNLQGIRESGHRLKGSCMVAGLENLLAIARSFEHMQEIPEDEIDQMKTQLLGETELVKRKIEEYLQLIPGKRNGK